MTTNSAPAPDPRPILAGALDALTPHVDAAAGRLDLPTPCEGWDVHALLAHLLAVEHRIAHIMGGGHFDDTPRQREAEGGDWSAAWREGRAVLDAALADDAVLATQVQHPAGVMPGARALFIYVSEITTHTWDLATALGRESGIDEGVAAAVLGPMQAALPAEGRGSEQVPFGEVVAVPDDADVVDRLMGWLGRDPAWTAPVSA